MESINNVLKRLFDIIFSLLGLLFLLPVFIITFIMVKVDSKGPVFYGGKRVGKNGELFDMLKFRTMHQDADNISNSSSCPENDPRITKLGSFLRKYKLNELPQLINVLRGEMSVVGPRPQVKWAVDRYSDENKKMILSVRPGITDYASIEFSNEGEILRGSIDPDKDYLENIEPGKIKLELEYIKNRSLWVDAKIIARTAKVVLLG